MTNEESFKRRASLSLPHERIDPPNATMVDRNKVQISIKEHQRQRDQETATVQEREKQLNIQRHSLATATEIVEHLHKINSATETHNFVTNVKNKNNQLKK
ncbi:unnamed protein product [Adineta steineri]|uniref:Uncharacterized protein n=1 Tax=Adineta steineri TaxID=433720 RepID=A0A813PEA4_9BILA|nr:unnamed protein product [Adineta steineri]CAF0822766.1 unnamed protein product [Adineta steineri]CAF0863239.1 unnamed protein product [Adineta steineri]